MKSPYAKTTLNVKAELRMLLERYSKNSGLPEQAVMKKFLEKIITEKLKNPGFSETTLRYQQPAEGFKPLHISLTKVEYDRFWDIKKLCMCSLSLLLAIAMETYGEDILYEKDCDSYRTNSYVKCFEIKNKIVIYAFMWKIPEKQIKISIPPD